MKCPKCQAEMKQMKIMKEDKRFPESKESGDYTCDNCHHKIFQEYKIQ